MATFAEDATLNAYTYDSDGFKKPLNADGNRSDASWSVTPQAETTDRFQAKSPTSNFQPQTSNLPKTFHTVESQMMSYIENTFRFDLLTDHLGSITAIMDGSQIRTFDTRYSAYGRNNWSTGTSCGFGWVGSYGYRETGLFHMSHYVRARHYSYVTGNWSTVDPLWPFTPRYNYVNGRPTVSMDPSGMHPCDDRTKGYGDHARGQGGQNWGYNCFEMVSGAICQFIKIVKLGILPYVPPGCAQWADCVNKGLYDCVERGIGCGPSPAACWDRTRETGGYGTPPHPCIELQNLGCPPSQSVDNLKSSCCTSEVFCEQEQYGFLNSPQGRCGKLDYGCSQWFQDWAESIGIKFPFAGSDSERQGAASKMCCQEKVWDSIAGRRIRRMQGEIS